MTIKIKHVHDQTRVDTTKGLRKRLAENQPLDEASYQELFENEQHFSDTIIDSMPGILYFYDARGQFLRWNQNFERVSGYSGKEILHMHPLDFFAAEEKDALQQRIGEVFDKGESSIEASFLSKDGTTTPYFFTGRRVVFNGAVCLVGVGIDVSERKQIENALVGSEHKYRELVELANSIILRWGSDGRITFLNEFGQKFFGYSSEEIIGRHVIGTLVPLSDSSGLDLQQLMDDICQNPKAFEQNINENMLRNGERVWIAWTNKTVRNEQGQIIGILSIGTDVTDRRLAENEIKYKNTMLQTQQETSLDAILIVDKDTRIISYNQQFIDLWHLPPQILKAGLDPPALTAVIGQVENAEAFITRVQYLYEHPEIKSHEEILLKDGRVIDRYSASIIGADGNYYGRIWYFRDITERKVAEERILSLNRVYAMLSAINTLIVHAHDRNELFIEACRIAVEAGALKMAWIGLVDYEAGIINPVGSGGNVGNFFEAAPPEIFEIKLGCIGRAGQAVQQLRPMISNDIENDRQKLVKTGLEERGIRSFVVLPLIVEGKAIGVLSLYSPIVGFFDEEEMRLLQNLAGDISFAIDHIEKQDRLYYLAFYDELTGLANRSLFLERVAQYIRSAKNGGYKLVVCLIDLERFKNINDSLGRAIGDALLKQVAEWLSLNVGDGNLVARLGADHFALVLPGSEKEHDAVELLERIIEVFLNHPYRLNDDVFRIAAKFGVALFPDNGSDAEILFKNAEAALKKTKVSGERYLFYTQEMTDTVAIKVTLENQLRQALDREEFVLHYQPKINLESGKITGAEALIRWNDPNTGLVPPGHFIPILEETGLIYDVGRWALRQAVSDYLRWHSAGLIDIRIAVNVSPLQLRHRDFIAELEQVLGVNPAAAAGLELEITESVIMEDIKHSIEKLNKICAMNVTIAIDDFGTGFSSLSYLAKLPADTLKIDRSFVTEMTAAPEGLALVSTIIDLGHSMKLKVIAEGVETEEQSRLLRLLNCDEMQGYLFSKPVPAEVFEAKFLTAIFSKNIS